MFSGRPATKSSADDAHAQDGSEGTAASPVSAGGGVKRVIREILASEQEARSAVETARAQAARQVREAEEAAGRIVNEARRQAAELLKSATERARAQASAAEARLEQEEAAAGGQAARDDLIREIAERVVSLVVQPDYGAPSDRDAPRREAPRDARRDAGTPRAQPAGEDTAG